MRHFGVLQVVPPGIEPGTQGFSVLCSTNWAMAPSFCGCKDRVKSLISEINEMKMRENNFLWKKLVFLLLVLKICLPLQRKRKKQTFQSECSAVGSALRSGRRGRAFESPHSDRRAADDSISFAALSYYSSVINNFVIILCGMRLFISLQMIGWKGGGAI